MSEHNARRWNATNDEYHAETGVYGRSMLDTFRESPMLFHGRFVTGEIPLRERTPSLRFGSDFDRFLLDRESVVEIPANVLKKVKGEISRAGAKGSNAWKEFEVEHAGELLLKTAEWDIFQRMADNIHNHRDASALIIGQPQVSVRWEDELTGLSLKVRPDVLGDGRIVDLKTSADPTPRAFATSIEKFGYHRQAGMYTWGMEQLLDRDHEWYFIAIRNVAPWDVFTYTLTAEWIVRGLHEIRETINALWSAIESDKWEPLGYGDTLQLSPPKWTEFDDPYEIGAHK